MEKKGKEGRREINWKEASGKEINRRGGAGVVNGNG
jgi:hypothetical protein